MYKKRGDGIRYDENVEHEAHENMRSHPPFSCASNEVSKDG